MCSRICDFSHIDVGDAFQFINHISQRGDKKHAGQSGVGVRRWNLKTEVVRFAPALCLFHTYT